MYTIGSKGIGYVEGEGFVMERMSEGGLCGAAHIVFLKLAAAFTVVFTL